MEMETHLQIKVGSKGPIHIKLSNEYQAGKKYKYYNSLSKIGVS